MKNAGEGCTFALLTDFCQQACQYYLFTSHTSGHIMRVYIILNDLCNMLG